MSALTLLANVGALIVLMWEASVFARFITDYPTRPEDEWERENVGERR
jgi:hypothetical protein